MVARLGEYNNACPQVGGDEEEIELRMDPTSISRCETRSVSANTVYILPKTIRAILLDICRDKLAIGHSAGASPRRGRDNPLVVRTVEDHTCR